MDTKEIIKEIKKDYGKNAGIKFTKYNKDINYRNEIDNSEYLEEIKSHLSDQFKLLPTEESNNNLIIKYLSTLAKEEFDDNSDINTLLILLRENNDEDETKYNLHLFENLINYVKDLFNSIGLIEDDENPIEDLSLLNNLYEFFILDTGNLINLLIKSRLVYSINNNRTNLVIEYLKTLDDLDILYDKNEECLKSIKSSYSLLKSIFPFPIINEFDDNLIGSIKLIFDNEEETYSDIEPFLVDDSIIINKQLLYNFVQLSFLRFDIFESIKKNEYLINIVKRYYNEKTNNSS